MGEVVRRGRKRSVDDRRYHVSLILFSAVACYTRGVGRHFGAAPLGPVLGLGLGPVLDLVLALLLGPVLGSVGAQPEAAQPEAAQPEAAQPEAAQPEAARLDAPTDGERVSGRVEIRGRATAADPSRFSFYRVHYGPGSSPSTLRPIGPPGEQPVESGRLVDWDTSVLSPGEYLVLLTVYDTGGNTATARVRVSVEPAAILPRPVGQPTPGIALPLETPETEPAPEGDAPDTPPVDAPLPPPDPPSPDPVPILPIENPVPPPPAPLAPIPSLDPAPFLTPSFDSPSGAPVQPPIPPYEPPLLPTVPIPTPFGL